MQVLILLCPMIKFHDAASGMRLVLFWPTLDRRSGSSFERRPAWNPRVTPMLVGRLEAGGRRRYVRRSINSPAAAWCAIFNPTSDKATVEATRRIIIDRYQDHCWRIENVYHKKRRSNNEGQKCTDGGFYWPRLVFLWFVFVCLWPLLLTWINFNSSMDR